MEENKEYKRLTAISDLRNFKFSKILTGIYSKINSKDL